MSDRDVDRFDQWAPTYDRSWLQEQFFQPVHHATLERAEREVVRPTRILDIGCGTGELLWKAGNRFPDAELVGVDPAAGMVRQARTAVSPDISARFVRSNAENLPFHDGSFDLVFSTMSFHHWPDQRRGLCEIRRVLAPEGTFVLTDGVVSGLANWVLGVWRPGRFHSSKELNGMLDTEQFQVIRCLWVPKMNAGGNGVQVTISRAIAPP